MAEYEAWLADQHNLDELRAEALERMHVNVGLIAENIELKRRVRQFEEGERQRAAGQTTKAGGAP